MKHYDVVFVVLTYRNTSDLDLFFKSNHIRNSKTIVVNSYYDEESEIIFKDITNRYKADFLSVPNKGYGAGNNFGIRYAIENYLFDFLIISNPDIEISKLELDDIRPQTKCIIAPKIITSSGKNQNPSSPFAPIEIMEQIKEWMYKKNHRYLIWSMYIISRINKLIYYSISTFRKKIFSPHGAFIIFPNKVITELTPIFNENMFLFNEEEHLGFLAKSHNISIVYYPKYVIKHKEDGSVRYLNQKTFDLMKQSFLEFRKFWREKK